MEGYVYLFATWKTNKYKIGITKGSIDKRIKQLSTGSFDEIILVKKYKSKNYKKIEKMLHNKFYSNNEQLEWFDLRDEDVFKFETYCREYDNIIDFLKENNHFYK